MITRPDGLDLRRSLRSVLGDNNPVAVEKAAKRQERTIDAVLRRLYNDDDEHRREIVLLADEVGLGKTFVALGVAWSVLHRRSAAGLSIGPVLVVTPHAHALFRKWEREAERFVQLVAPPSIGFDVKTASTPHDLAHALRKRKPTLVIARMSAFSGRLHQLDTARLAAIPFSAPHGRSQAFDGRAPGDAVRLAPGSNAGEPRPTEFPGSLGGCA